MVSENRYQTLLVHGAIKKKLNENGCILTRHNKNVNYEVTYNIHSNTGVLLIQIGRTSLIHEWEKYQLTNIIKLHPEYKFNHI